MTGPAIPADKWPEHSEVVFWDAEGQSFELRVLGREWGLIFTKSHIPMPDGWDWRVPVMRQQPQAIDLEQFIALAKFGEAHAFTAERRPHSMTVYSQARRLLALIGGQSEARSSSEHSSEAVANLVTDDAVRRLVRAMENTPGDELIEPNTRLCRRLLVAAMRPTKGEGE